METKLTFNSYWAPTEECVTKLLHVQLENSLNIVNKDLDNKTYYEDIIINKNADNFFDSMPNIKKSPLYKEYVKIFAYKKSEAEFKAVFSKTGGLLNLYNPSIKEDMDKEFKAALHSENKEEALETWRNTKSELWSNLTPNLVWAGGGKLENDLLLDFNMELVKVMQGRHFVSEGGALLEAIRFLRVWQYMNNRICGNRKPVEAIIEERQEIFERKVEFYKLMGIQCEFCSK